MWKVRNILGTRNQELQQNNNLFPQAHNVCDITLYFLRTDFSKNLCIRKRKIKEFKRFHETNTGKDQCKENNRKCTAIWERKGPREKKKETERRRAQRIEGNKKWGPQGNLANPPLLETCCYVTLTSVVSSVLVEWHSDRDIFYWPAHFLPKSITRIICSKMHYHSWFFVCFFSVSLCHTH